MTVPTDPAATAPSRVWQLLDTADGTHEHFLHHDYVPAKLLDLMPRPPRVVLDVGCFAGATGAAIKQRHPGARVIGIEPAEAPARRAAGRLDAVHNTTLEALDFEAAGLLPGSVDTVVLADVLEHMYNPWRTLLLLKRCLSADAQVLVSLPNVRNLWIMDRMARGHWTYEGQGLLDITHIRFFGRREAEALFRETGYGVGPVHCHLDDRCRQILERQQSGPPFQISTDTLTLRNLSRDDLVELATLQFLFVATPLADPPMDAAA